MPGSRSSEPVDRITTRGRGRDRTRAPGRPRRAARGGAGRGRCPPRRARRPPRRPRRAAGRAGPAAGACVDPDLGDAAVGPLVGHHRVGAGRHRGAGHDLDGGARATARSSLAWPAPISPTTGRCTGASSRGVGDVGVRARRTRPSRSCRSDGSAIGGDDVLGARRGRAPPSAAAGRPAAARRRRGSARGGRRPRSSVRHQPSAREHGPGGDPLGGRRPSSSTSPTTWTPWPKVQSPSTVSDVASFSDGAPSGKRLSNSPTSL